jgi:hypothetical protein
VTDLIPDDEGFTELVDPSVPRVDLVDRPANGAPGWLLMKQDAQGLMDPGVIRDLIGKSEPGPEPADDTKETVTMTGSPAAIAKLIHEAAVRKTATEPDPVAKAPMSTADQNDLPDSDFAYVEPGGKKDESGKTTPRSLRHFPINDEAHVRNALARAPQSPFGDKAMPKIRSAAKKFGIDVAKTEEVAKDMEIDEGVDGMDPTVILAAPDEDAPGDPTDPGSPAWEAIDAATACKWTSILARARSALSVLADREMLEAASADPDDADNAMDLDDAACAIDYAISVLAPFAVDEQAEADCGTAEMEAVGKALHSFDPAPLEVLEGLAPVAKAGRTLSSANEQAIRGAVESLQKVLASLPAAPDAKENGRPVAKTANEEPNMPKPTAAEDATEASGQEPAMGTQQAEPKPVAGLPVAETAMAKASGEKTPMVVVYDQKGRLIGIVDPGDVTPVANSDSDADDGSDAGSSDDGPDDTAADAAPETTDLTPAPAAEVGTPADAAPSDDDVTKTEATNPTETSQDVLKSSIADVVKAALDDYSASQEQVIAKQAETIAQQAEVVKMLEDRINALEEQPVIGAVMANGAVPPKHLMRGQDRGAPADLTHAQQLRKRLAESDSAIEKKQIADEMQTLAIAKFQKMQQRH